MARAFFATTMSVDDLILGIMLADVPVNWDICPGNMLP
jgi:hypothetical protein